VYLTCVIVHVLIATDFDVEWNHIQHIYNIILYIIIEVSFLPSCHSFCFQTVRLNCYLDGRDIQILPCSILANIHNPHQTLRWILSGGICPFTRQNDAHIFKNAERNWEISHTAKSSVCTDHSAHRFRNERHRRNTTWVESGTNRLSFPL